MSRFCPTIEVGGDDFSITFQSHCAQGKVIVHERISRLHENSEISTPR